MIRIRVLTGRIEEEWRKEYLSKRSPAEIRSDLCKAFDQIAALKLKVWVLSGVVVAQSGIVGWLATELFSRMK